MKKRLQVSVLAAAAILFLYSCKKETEDLNSPTIEDYSPLVVGKYITYQLDSSVMANFGASIETHSYEVKYVVDAAITDANNRPSFRIVRFKKRSNGTWDADATFMATPVANGLEFVENNLRYIKLRVPISDGYTWKGNSHIDTYSINSEVKYLDDWDYTYENVGMAETIGTYQLDEVLTVNQRDEIIGNPNDPNSYSEVNYGQEKYAKGIGMVYRKFLHTEYQPSTTGGNGHFADGTYGVTMTMIDHN